MSPQYKQGFDDGYKFAVNNFTANNGYAKQWPEDWGRGLYGNGWAEGTRSGLNFVLSRDFKGWTEYTSDEQGNRYVGFKDGKRIYL